jgi:hypothetical protein
MIDRVVGNKLLPTNIRHDIIERTDGIPLFVEEMTKAVLEAESEGDVRKTAAAVPSTALAVPASLHASLMARLDRLGPAKEVAQIGAAMGRKFSHALLAAVVRKSEEELGSALDRLTAAGLLFRQGVPPQATYLFKHALLQDAAYGTLLREPRRALHARIAETLESRFAEIAENQPEILARHFTCAMALTRLVDAGKLPFPFRRFCEAEPIRHQRKHGIRGNPTRFAGRQEDLDVCDLRRRLTLLGRWKRADERHGDDADLCYGRPGICGRFCHGRILEREIPVGCLASGLDLLARLLVRLLIDDIRSQGAAYKGGRVVGRVKSRKAGEYLENIPKGTILDAAVIVLPERPKAEHDLEVVDRTTPEIQPVRGVTVHCPQKHRPHEIGQRHRVFFGDCFGKCSAHFLKSHVRLIRLIDRHLDLRVRHLIDLRKRREAHRCGEKHACRRERALARTTPQLAVRPPIAVNPQVKHLIPPEP